MQSTPSQSPKTISTEDLPVSNVCYICKGDGKLPETMGRGFKESKCLRCDGTGRTLGEYSAAEMRAYNQGFKDAIAAVTKKNSP